MEILLTTKISEIIISYPSTELAIYITSAKIPKSILSLFHQYPDII